jgi:hypothetical protein
MLGFIERTSGSLKRDPAMREVVGVAFLKVELLLISLGFVGVLWAMAHYFF